MIKNVVFDLGRVLFDFTFVPFTKLLQDAGADFVDEGDFVRRAREADFECGQLSTEEFLSGIEARLIHLPPRVELVKHYSEIFTPIPQVLALVAALRQKGEQRVFVLSNTNILHWEYIERRFALTSLVDGVLTSFEVGAMKPDAKIFYEAAKRFSLVPHETVFLDDISENIAGARACGWDGFVHRSYAETVGELAKRGVRVLPRFATNH